MPSVLTRDLLWQKPNVIELINFEGINYESYTCLYLNDIIYILFLDNPNSTNLIICTGCQER